MNKKIKIAVVDYGNIGRGVESAIEKNPDATLTAIITRNPKRVFDERRKTRKAKLELFNANNESC